ncbi:MAG: antibiotic biosynthesis monooxygenase [Pseudomonadota bacterium]
MKSGVVLRGYIDIPALSWDAVLAELSNHVQLTLAEDGCQCFEVDPDRNVPHRLTVYEEFRSAASFEAHQRRVKASRWGRLTEGAERHYEITTL